MRRKLLILSIAAVILATGCVGFAAGYALHRNPLDAYGPCHWQRFEDDSAIINCENKGW